NGSTDPGLEPSDRIHVAFSVPEDAVVAVIPCARVFGAYPQQIVADSRRYALGSGGGIEVEVPVGSSQIEEEPDLGRAVLIVRFQRGRPAVRVESGGAEAVRSGVE